VKVDERRDVMAARAKKKGVRVKLKPGDYQLIASQDI
jgi:hypothetical protein